MDLSILIFVLAGIFVIPVLRQRYNPPIDYREAIERLKESTEAQMPKPHRIRFHGGPLDGKEDQTLHDSPFGFVEYTPEDDEDKIQIGEVMGQPIYKPSLAYYRLIDDGEYFYVRDVTPQEAMGASTGQMPAVEANDE